MLRIVVAVGDKLELGLPVESVVAAYAETSSDFVVYDMVVEIDRENWPEVDGEGP